MDYYVMVLKKYNIFEGRSTRSEYWYFVLFNLIITIALSVIVSLLLGEKISGIVQGIYGLALLIPTLAVSVRRLHDTDHSGWWLLINFIPLIGFIIFTILTTQDSNSGTNTYGANPKTHKSSNPEKHHHAH